MSAAVAVLLPSKPDILTDFFASERAGQKVACESYIDTAEPLVPHFMCTPFMLLTSSKMQAYEFLSLQLEPIAACEATTFLTRNWLAKWVVMVHAFLRGRVAQFCRDAHSDAVWVGSFVDFLSNSVVVFLVVTF